MDQTTYTWWWPEFASFSTHSWCFRLCRLLSHLIWYICKALLLFTCVHECSSSRVRLSRCTIIQLSRRCSICRLLTSWGCQNGLRHASQSFHIRSEALRDLSLMRRRPSRTGRRTCSLHRIIRLLRLGRLQHISVCGHFIRRVVRRFGSCCLLLLLLCLRSYQNFRHRLLLYSKCHHRATAHSLLRRQLLALLLRLPLHLLATCRR